MHTLLFFVTSLFIVMSDDGSEPSSTQETPIVDGGRKSLLSRVFAALSNRRRRYVLYYLRNHEQAQTDELAAQIAAWEQEIPRSEVPAEDTHQVHRALVHSHLPKLEDYGLVEYDRRSDTVSYTYPPTLLDEALELTSSLENPE